MAVLAAFLKVALDDELTAMRIDDAALSQCPRCAALPTRGERLSACLAPSRGQPACGVRLIVGWQGLEVLVVAVCEQLDCTHPDPKVIDLLNRYIATTGALHPQIVVDDEGLLRQGYHADTLYGQVLFALVTLVAQHFGDVLHANVSALTVPEGRRVADEARKFYRHARRQRLANRAMRTSQRMVAREERADRATIREYMRRHSGGPQEEHPDAGEGG